MAKEDIRRYQELITTDTEFQEKFRKAVEGYKGDTDEKSVFENIILPLGKEYGLSATYEEFNEYVGALTATADSELSEDELEQVAGGKVNGGGVGITQCTVFGTGLGAAGGEYGGGLCLAIGLGWNKVACLTAGKSGVVREG